MIPFPSPEGYSKVHVYHAKEDGRFIVLRIDGREAIECSWDGVSEAVYEIKKWPLFI
jgi:hypothetical protein